MFPSLLWNIFKDHYFVEEALGNTLLRLCCISMYYGEEKWKVSRASVECCPSKKRVDKELY